VDLLGPGESREACPELVERDITKLHRNDEIVEATVAFGPFWRYSVVRGCGRAKLSEKKNALCERKER
jgi:hypothetical protein